MLFVIVVISVSRFCFLVSNWVCLSFSFCNSLLASSKALFATFNSSVNLLAFSSKAFKRANSSSALDNFSWDTLKFSWVVFTNSLALSNSSWIVLARCSTSLNCSCFSERTLSLSCRITFNSFILCCFLSSSALAAFKSSPIFVNLLSAAVFSAFAWLRFTWALSNSAWAFAVFSSTASFSANVVLAVSNSKIAVSSSFCAVSSSFCAASSFFWTSAFVT